MVRSPIVPAPNHLSFILILHARKEFSESTYGRSFDLQFFHWPLFLIYSPSYWVILRFTDVLGEPVLLPRDKKRSTSGSVLVRKFFVNNLTLYICMRVGVWRDMDRSVHQSNYSTTDQKRRYILLVCIFFSGCKFFNDIVRLSCTSWFSGLCDSMSPSLFHSR